MLNLNVTPTFASAGDVRTFLPGGALEADRRRTNAAEGRGDREHSRTSWSQLSAAVKPEPAGAARCPAAPRSPAAPPTLSPISREVLRPPPAPFLHPFHPSNRVPPRFPPSAENQRRTDGRRPAAAFLKFAAACKARAERFSGRILHLRACGLKRLSGAWRWRHGWSEIIAASLQGFAPAHIGGVAGVRRCRSHVSALGGGRAAGAARRFGGGRGRQGPLRRVPVSGSPQGAQAADLNRSPGRGSRRGARGRIRSAGLAGRQGARDLRGRRRRGRGVLETRC